MTLAMPSRATRTSTTPVHGSMNSETIAGQGEQAGADEPGRIDLHDSLLVAAVGGRHTVP
jgi:hypothetical protein